MIDGVDIDPSTVVTEQGIFQYLDEHGLACDPADAVQVYIHDFNSGSTLRASLPFGDDPGDDDDGGEEEDEGVRADDYNPAEPRDAHGEWTSGGGGIDDMRQLVEATKTNGGVSYQPFTHDSPKPGDEAYMVSPYPERSEILDVVNLTGKKLHDYVMHNQDVLTKTDHYLGTWYDSEGTKKVFLDVSIKAPTPDEAVRICGDHNQIAYFSFKDMRSHDVQPNKREEWVPNATATADSAHADPRGPGGQAGEHHQTLRVAHRQADVRAGDRRAARVPSISGHRGLTARADDFDPAEPRVPKGGKGAGEWTRGGAKTQLSAFTKFAETANIPNMERERQNGFERRRDVENAQHEASIENSRAGHRQTQLSNLPNRPGDITRHNAWQRSVVPNIPTVKSRSEPTQLQILKHAGHTTEINDPNSHREPTKDDPYDHPSFHQRFNSNQPELKARHGDKYSGVGIRDLPNLPRPWAGRSLPGYHGAEPHSVVPETEFDPKAISGVIGGLNLREAANFPSGGAGHRGATGERMVGNVKFFKDEPKPMTRGPHGSEGYEHAAASSVYHGTDEMELEDRIAHFRGEAEMYDREINRLLSLPPAERYGTAFDNRLNDLNHRVRMNHEAAQEAADELREQNRTSTPSTRTSTPESEPERSEHSGDDEIFDGDGYVNKHYGGPGVPNYDQSPSDAHAGNPGWEKGQVKTVVVDQKGDWGRYPYEKEIELIKNPSPKQLANWVLTQPEKENTEIRWIADPVNGDIYCFDASRGWHIGPMQALGIAYKGTEKDTGGYINSDEMVTAEHWPEQVETWLKEWQEPEHYHLFGRRALSKQAADRLSHALDEPVDPEEQARLEHERRMQLREERGDSVQADDYDPNEPRKGKGPGGGEWTAGGGGSGGGKSTPKWSENPKPAPEKTFGTEILPDQSGKYHVGNNLDAAVQLLGAGKDIELDQPREVSTLMDKLASIGREAAKGIKKIYDLCHVSVLHTNLFCAEHVGVPRAEMPQLKGVPEKGSRAAELEANKKGEVDIAQHFHHHLEKHGHAVTKDVEDASYLRASQRELDGVKVAGMMQAIREGKIPESRIWVTKDNYVLDGHHRWAALVALEYAEGKPIPMKVFRVDMPIVDAIKDANHFAEKWGIKSKPVGAPVPTAKADSVCPSCGVRSDAINPSKLDEILTHLKAGEILSTLKRMLH